MFQILRETIHSFLYKYMTFWTNLSKVSCWKIQQFSLEIFCVIAMKCGEYRLISVFDNILLMTLLLLSQDVIYHCLLRCDHMCLPVKSQIWSRVQKIPKGCPRGNKREELPQKCSQGGYLLRLILQIYISPNRKQMAYSK